jgi:hypothetical protein
LKEEVNQPDGYLNASVADDWVEDGAVARFGTFAHVDAREELVPAHTQPRRSLSGIREEANELVVESSASEKQTFPSFRAQIQEIYAAVNKVSIHEVFD